MVGMTKSGWKKEVAYILTLLCLIDCLLPYTRSPLRARPDGKDATLKMFEGMEGLRWWRSQSEEKWFPKEQVDGLKDFPRPCWNNRCFRRDYTVFILADLLIGETSNGENGAGPEELSLIDMELIDCLWRQDIDVEKDLLPSAPEYQHERDFHILNEKMMLQMSSGRQQAQNYSLSQEDLLRSWTTGDDMIAAQKQYFADDIVFGELSPEGKVAPLCDKGIDALEAVLNNNPVMPNEQFPVSHQVDQLVPDNQPSFSPSNLSLVEPFNDVYLYNWCPQTQDVERGTNESTSFIGRGEGDLETPEPMDWQSNQFLPADFNSLPALTSTYESGCTVDGFLTPQLELSNVEVQRLFTDRQVVEDVAEAQNIKECVNPSDLSLMPSQEQTTSLWDEATDQVLGTFDVTMPTSHQDYPVHPLDNNIFAETLMPTGNLLENSEYGAALFENDQFRRIKTEDIDCNEYGGTASVSSNDYSAIASDHDYLPWSPRSSSATSDFSDDQVFMNQRPTSTKSEAESTYSQPTASDRDNDLAHQYNLPVTGNDIVSMPMEEYQRLLLAKSLSEAQVDLIRKIRRRGKNKLAAKNCRQRHSDNLQTIQQSVEELEKERDRLADEQQHLMDDVQKEKRLIAELQRRQL